MVSLSLRHLLAIFSLAALALSLGVTLGSDCEILCLSGPNGTTIDAGPSGTNSSDIVCENEQYSTSATGIKFKLCAECLQKSDATKGPENDAAWLLYNLRYTLDVCLFDYPDAISSINSPCIINSACRPLKNALTAGLTNPNAGNQYDYCTADSDRFASSNWWSCVRCLQSSDSQSYLSNFLIALKAGCQQKPTDGALIGLTGDIFSTKAVNITESNTNTTMPGDGGASSTTMTMGTIVGIAVGGGLVFIGAVCLFIVYCRKQRKQRAQNDNTDLLPPDLSRSRASSFTAINRSPYMPITDHKKSSSINSYNYELQEKQAYNNADYYDKMEQEMQGGREMSHYNFDPRQHHHGLGSALPTHPAYIPRAMSRQSAHPSASATPPNGRRANTPDSFALQSYLNAVNEEGTIDVIQPPPAQPRDLQQHESSAPAHMASIPPPPPGPPPARKPSTLIPSISIPSLSRMRVPKKYSPPQITVQEATPVADRGETSNLQISQPLAFHHERFQDKPLAGGAVMSNAAPARENPQDYEGDMPIRSGKSTLYGY
ncbi:exo-alpha-sialidase neuraminidase [Colletotrichum sojae]|uniref:Exo-alpha-sialidase neuraminidase n=1 Tax=Colletotrichum sojae TaxID=2175907 RepID=A0A8H6JUV6_9PEZI|nr:exo-alpha-sialidase neuraminidase [Colletotrichum sojae]